MDENSRREHDEFENEVRRIARQLWPNAEYGGARMLGGREHDGVFETEECVHFVEATTSRTKAKAETDIAKMVGQAGLVQRKTSGRAVRCWFVTREEPTADQRKVADRHRALVNALSFSQFQSKLINARSYLDLREHYAFGSARDPATGKGAPPVDYIELQLSDRANGGLRSSRDLLNALAAGGRIVILGDYGAGKSMTLRFLHKGLRQAYLSGRTPRFPVYVNLRDHFGQSEPSEILERHARSVGFSPPSHLVRAWRAGYIHLLLDGFDEVTTVNIQGLWRKLQDNRYRAMEAVRRLLREHPPGAGVVVAGRAHFFDSEKERRGALGIDGAYQEVSLTEFSEDQIREYLAKSGFVGEVPEWMPSRPLLVAYLGARGLLAELSRLAGGASGLDPAGGWDYLLDRIAAREAEIEAGIDGPTVRRILERLATKARAFQGGLGPLDGDTVVSAFREICGYVPDERGMVLLQRLPGLGIERAEVETRSFVDEDFADTCRAGDVLDYLVNPYGTESIVASPLECGLGSLAIAIVAKRAEVLGCGDGKVNAAIRRARDVGSDQLVCDLVRCGLESGAVIDQNITVSGLLVAELELKGNIGDASKVEFSDCYFGRIELDSDLDTSRLPRLRQCFIAIVEGRLTSADLPPGRFDDCVVDEFAAEASTTNAVLDLDLPLGVRVLITVLKKLYERRGSGRRENALFRGLDYRSRRLVPEVLKLLQREGLAMMSRRGTDKIWLPDRASRRRVGALIASPSVVDDPLLREASEIE